MLLRSAAPEDALSVAKVHVRSWRAAYRELLPQDYLDRLRPEDRAASYDFSGSDVSKPSTIVAVDGGQIRGFATTMPSRDSDAAGHGELCALYVDPEYWGRGMGVALVSAARQRLFEVGFRSAMLWVLKGNLRAERFYKTDGWISSETNRMDVVWGIKVCETVLP